MHISLHTVQKVDGGKGKMVGEQPLPIKKTTLKKTTLKKEKSCILHKR